MRPVVALTGLLLAGGATTVQAQQRAHRELPLPPLVFDSGVAAATLDSVWRLVRDTHYDKNLKGLDWNALRNEFRARAAASPSNAALRVVLNELLQRLGDSHYGVIPAEAIPAPTSAFQKGDEPGQVGVEVRVLDDALVVTRVSQGGSAWRAGVRPGWTLERIDTTSAALLVAGAAHASTRRERRVAMVQSALAAERRLNGVRGTVVDVVFTDAGRVAKHVTLTREGVQGEVLRLGNLPPLHAQLESTKIPDGAGCVGVIRFTAWVPALAAPFERAVQQVRTCDGVVLDLRGNLGGVLAMVIGISGWFADQEVPLGIMKTRDAELRYMVSPRRSTSAGERVSPYAGPLAILVDRHTASTSEIFAAGMQHLGRARVFGDSTAGQALPATMARLPNNDILMFAIADFTTPAGVRLDGRGVIPDELVVVGQRDLVGENDPVQDAALAWVRGTRRTAQAGHDPVRH